jgi:hypothetical protein
MKHLSPEQISKWICDDLSQDEKQHARECSQCAAAVAEFQETLSVFGETVKQWAHDEAPQRSWRRPERHVLQWVGIAAAIVIAALVPFYAQMQIREREVRAREDALLLERVDEQISRDVPKAMEPWLELLSSAYIEESGGAQ